MHKHSVIAMMLITSGIVHAAPPSTQPATRPKDSAVDFLLGHATTAPSHAAPTSKPANVFEKDKADLGYRKGSITTSDGEKIPGRIATTLEKPVRVWDDEKKEYRDIPFALIKSMEAKILWEREEKEWHFKESGSDIKEYSGKTYPAREMVYIVTLANGDKVTGSTSTPLYLDLSSGDDKVFILHKRDKGEIGQTLKDLVYVKSVLFED